MIAAEDGVQCPLAPNRRVASTSGRFKIVVFNHATIDSVTLNRVLTSAINVVIENPATLQSVQEKTITHIAMERIFPAPDSYVVGRYYQTVVDAPIRIL